MLDAGLARADGVARDGQVPDEREAVPTRRPSVRGRRSVQEPRRRPAPPQADRGGERRGRRGPARPAASGARSLLQRRHRPDHGGVLRSSRARCSATRTSPATRRKSRRRSRRRIAGTRSTRTRRPIRGRPSSSPSTSSKASTSRRWGTTAPTYIHTSAEAVKLAMGDREKYLGDMDFITIPYEGLLSKDYAAERRKLIDPERASLELRPGESVQVHDPRGRLRRLSVPRHDRGRGRARRRHELPGGRRQGSQHGELRAEPAQRVGRQGRHGRSRDHLQLPGRLLLARRRRSQRARARQAPAIDAAEHAGDEGRPVRT